MSPKFLNALIVGALLCGTSLTAQTSNLSAAQKIKGRITAARIEGSVEVVSKADGTAKALHEGDQITDQTEIKTAANSIAILVLSNGASLNIASESTVDVEEFIQDPFASSVKFSDMKEEPGTSITRINIIKGELVGKVVHLNVDKGSEFSIGTPVGAAGIRGTVFRIVFRPNKDGTARFVVMTTEGRVVFKGVTGTTVNIPAGKQVSATFSYTAPTAANPQGAAESTGVTIVSSNVTTEEAAQVQVAAQAIQTAVIDIVNTPPAAGSGAVISHHDASNTGDGQSAASRAASTPQLVQPTSPAIVSPSS